MDLRTEYEQNRREYNALIANGLVWKARPMLRWLNWAEKVLDESEDKD